MPWILASSAYSFHQLLPSWLWSPAGCILESVLGPWGSSGVLFFWLFFSFFLFLCLWSSFSSCRLSSFSYCSCSSSYLLLSFSPSFISSSCHLPPFSCLPSLSSCFFLGSSCCLLSSNCPPVPPVTLLSLSVILLSSVVSFFLAFCLLVSLVLLSPHVCGLPSLPALFTCRLFLLFLSDHCLLGDASCRHLCFPFHCLLHYSCPVPGASPHPPSLFFSSASSLVPSVSYLSFMTSVSRTSLAPFFTKDLCSSPFISAGAGPSSASDFLRQLVPRLFLLLLVLSPLIPLVLFMMTLFSFLLRMMALIRRVLSSYP